MAQTKSKRSLAMKKRWAEKKAHEQLNRASTGMDDPTIANVVNASASGRAVRSETSSDIYESRINNLRGELDNTLDYEIRRRDQLREDLAMIERRIKIHRVHLGID